MHSRYESEFWKSLESRNSMIKRNTLASLQLQPTGFCPYKWFLAIIPRLLRQDFPLFRTCIAFSNRYVSLCRSPIKFLSISGLVKHGKFDRSLYFSPVYFICFRFQAVAANSEENKAAHLWPKVSFSTRNLLPFESRRYWEEPNNALWIVINCIGLWLTK